MAGTLDSDLKKSLVQTLIFPIFEYGNVLRMGMKRTHVHRLQVAQNACVRFVVPVPRFQHITPFLRSLEWQTIEQRVHLAVLKLIYKTLNGIAPSYLLESLELLGSGHEHGTRRTNLLAIPAHRTQAFDQSFIVMGSRLWNSLTPSVRCSSTLAAFHKGVVAYLRSQEV